MRVQLFSGPLLQDGDGTCDLSPYQSALLTLVFAEESITRLRIAEILWRGRTESRTRQSIRQLKSEIRRRCGAQVIATDGDLLVAPGSVASDARELRGHVDGGRLSKAAVIVSDGLACEDAHALPDAFHDWGERFCRELRGRIARRARAKWEAARTAGDWSAARDAAEAIYILQEEDDPTTTANVIEARARVGRLQAAEVAYAELRDRLPESDMPDVVEEAIQRVRAVASAESTQLASARVPFVGRVDAIASLTNIFDDVRAGTFSFALVSGEAGIGKTRLIGEVERAARLEGFRCLRAEPVELERRISLNPIIDAISDIELAPHLDAIGEPWRTVIGTMLPPGPHAESVQNLPPIDEKNLSRRLLDAFSLLLRSISNEQPTIFFLDDLQWADATTISALRFYQRRWTESYFGVVATVRPTDVGRKNPADSYLSDDGKLNVQHLRLSELGEEEAHELVGLLAEDRIDDEAIIKLCALSGGHPLYLTELTRDYLSGRLVLPASEADAFSIPISLKQIVGSRLEGAGPEARAILSTLAVGSRPMRLSDLGHILELPLDRAADGADELRHRQLVELDRDRIWIAHDLFRAAIYRELSEPRRAVIHRRLADHLGRGSGEEAANELATHFERAGSDELAAKYGWIAAARAFERGAVEEAAHFYELVTRNEADPHRRAEATGQLATSLHLNRDMSRANPALELASTRLRAVGMTERARRMDIRRVEGLAEAGDTPVDELIERLSAIKAESRAADDWEGVALALDTELGLRHSSGDFPGIQGTFNEMRSIAAGPSRRARAVCYSGLAMGVLFGDPDEALRSAEAALHLTETIRAHRLRALLRLMVVLQFRGRLHQPKAKPIVSEARSLAKRSGDIRRHFSVESNVAVFLLDAGELDRAEHMLNESSKLLGSAEMDLARFNQANNYAELALARSNFQEARTHFEKARSYLGSTTPPYAKDLVEAGLALCALESGELREAQRREELITPLSPPWHFDPSTLVTFKTRVLELRGRQDQANQLLQETAENLEGRLEAAWLKINKLRIEKALKWDQREEAQALAEESRELAGDLFLGMRERQFARLQERLRTPT